MRQQRHTESVLSHGAIHTHRTKRDHCPAAEKTERPEAIFTGIFHWGYNTHSHTHLCISTQPIIYVYKFVIHMTLAATWLMSSVHELTLLEVKGQCKDFKVTASVWAATVLSTVCLLERNQLSLMHMTWRPCHDTTVKKTKGQDFI